jgi:hypothetical protein
VVYARTLAQPVAATTGAISWHDSLQDWFNAMNGACVHLEDPQFGGEVSGSWHTALGNVRDAIEQDEVGDGGALGATILHGPRRYGFTQEVEWGTKRAIKFQGVAGRSSVDGGRGFGTAYYAKTASQRILDFDNSAGAVNHWGPLFVDMNFNGVLQPTTADLVRIFNCNHWGFTRCSFNYGRNLLQIGVRAAGGDPGALDSSYGLMEHVNFNNYTNRGWLMDVGQCAGLGINFNSSTSGAWGMEVGPYVANMGLYKLKTDGIANGIWNKGYANLYSMVNAESSKIGFQFDRDTGVGFSGANNVLHEYHATGSIGDEVGLRITANVNAYNEIQGYLHQGLGTILDDLSGGWWFGHGRFFDSEAPIWKFPSRTTHPPTPARGAYMYAIGGEMWMKDTAGQQVQQT